jgi:ribonuclease P protein component
VLAAKNRLRSSSDFSRTTKTGHRATSQLLVLYFLQRADLPRDPQLGLIINKSVGGSVTRHRIARQLRHIARDQMATLPAHTQLVVRVLKNSESYSEDLPMLIAKANKRLAEIGAKQ